MIEINEEKLKVKFKGVVIELDYPTVKQFEDFQQRAKENSASVVKDLIVAMGMSEDQYASLPARAAGQIFDELISLKKND